MALNRLGVEIGVGPRAEGCLDSTVLGLMQRTETLEEKVGQLFELLRDPVYLYLMASLGNSGEAEDITQETPKTTSRCLSSVIKTTADQTITEQKSSWIWTLIARNSLASGAQAVAK
jgi:hypothetical protein